ncbi:hypothetical protein B2J93_6006 [Marssonina coronariae]|uniref:Methanethiol oxidase n=1 Tax=Diplocarpon coronariae TaxID=2795749 RepID=A0A218YXN8_9HELO|nr:hypothetical protein JHW43_002443 [Diplocarpon mali]OWP00569.1 hypothetical protein B2J93_6006 [Marssonina coronariae]
MLSLIFKVLIVAIACSGSPVLSHRDAVTSLASRRITEFLLPVAAETHEVALVPNRNLVLVSQMDTSRLVKIQLDPITEEPVAFQSFPMGANNKSGLHGIFPSTIYPGLVWLTLQYENKILLVDPGAELSAAPTIVHTIDVPKPGNGPHGVYEIGNRLWAGLKTASIQDGNYYVFSTDISDLEATNPEENLYLSLESPLFIQEEPTTKLIFVTQHISSSIMRIDLTRNETTQLPIPPGLGNTPVGMVTAYGPMKGVWFCLAGNADGGSGAFGRIDSDGKMKFFQLGKQHIGSSAGLVHIADASSADLGPALWLLSTSELSRNSTDTLIRVTFDEGVTSIIGEEYISMPTQNSWVHRLVALNSTVLVSQLNSFTLAQFSYKNTISGQGPRSMF